MKNSEKEGASVTLTGENAEQFVRYRDTEKSQSALVRQERQKTYLQALLKKVQEQASEDAGFVTDLYDSIRDYTVALEDLCYFAIIADAKEENTTK